MAEITSTYESQPGMFGAFRVTERESRTTRRVVWLDVESDPHASAGWVLTTGGDHEQDESITTTQALELLPEDRHEQALELTAEAIAYLRGIGAATADTLAAEAEGA